MLQISGEDGAVILVSMLLYKYIVYAYVQIYNRMYLCI